MTARPTEDVIAALAMDAAPVEPLRAPLWRALATLGVILLLGALAILGLSNPQVVRSQSASAPILFAAECLAMLTTGILAVIGAFHLSVPGRSRWWIVAPLPTLAAWLLLSGMGCYRILLSGGGSAGRAESFDCLVFILAASVLVGGPLLWRLSRARPIDPVPVAFLGGLGTAALAAFLLQFFHASTITFLDLSVHLLAVGTVILLATALNRRALAPA